MEFEIARNILEKTLEKDGIELFNGTQILENNFSVLTIFSVPESTQGEYNIKEGRVFVIIPHIDNPPRCFICSETESLLKLIFDAGLKWNPDLEIPSFPSFKFDGTQIF